MKAPELIHYKDYIKSEYWTERKRLYFATHPHNCEVCGHPDVELHHLKYGEYGHEADKNLAALCRVHHEELHGDVVLRKNMFYQSRFVIEDMKHDWQARLNAPLQAKKVMQTHAAPQVPAFIDKTAGIVQAILNRFFKR